MRSVLNNVTTLALLIFTIFFISLYSYASNKHANTKSESTTTESLNLLSYGRDVEGLYVVILTDPSLVAHHQSKNNTPSVHRLKNVIAERIDINDAENQAYIQALDNKQKQVIANLSSSKKSNSVVLKAEMSFKIATNAFTIRLPKVDVATLKAMAAVQAVQKITPYKLMTDLGPSHIRATKVWQGGSNTDGFQGEGIIVGVLDTGINALHPSFAATGSDGFEHTNPLGNGVYLGDCLKPEYTQYCNSKLIGIWSHPQITNIINTPEIGLDEQGHGSHVASTVAGNIMTNVPVYNVIGEISNTQFEQISGVAPHANIVSYQVCDLDGCWPDITALAVEHAIANGINVINYSIGGEAMSPWDSIDAMAMLSAREAGIHVATSAGNNGPTSNSVSSPGNAPWLTSVAASTHGRNFTVKSLNYSGGNTQLTNMIGYSTTQGVTASIIDGASLANGDCLQKFAPNTLTNKVVVCRRGDIPRVEKGRNALAGNAAGMILVNTSSGNQSLNNDFHSLPAAHISSNDGNLLIAWLNDGSNDHQVSFNSSQMINDLDRADFIADFSSRGPEPIHENYLVPHVSAPGVNIYAANATEQPYYDPELQPEYEFLDGTSMASPHVAGALALISGLKPDWSPAQAQSALMLTASNINRLSNGDPATFFDSGAGTINVEKAINSALTMNETATNYRQANPRRGGDISLLNLPALVATDCMISCRWQRTFTASDSGTFTVSYNSQANDLKLLASSTQFTLSKGEEITLDISAQINAQYQSGYTSGHVIINADNDKAAVSLPVMASFKKGKHPTNIIIEASTDKGSSVIEDVYTIAANPLMATPYGISEIQQVKVNLLRDDFDKTTFPYSVYNDPLTLFSQALTLHPGTRYLEVTVLETQSPDLDLYIGADWNTNGVPDSFYEMNELLCQSATADALERCIVEMPPAGNYFVAIHNYGNPNNPSETIDSVSLEVITINANDSSIRASFNDNVIDNEDINLLIHWDAKFNKNSQYMTAVELGNDINSPDNVAFIPIRLIRTNSSISAAFNKGKIELGDAVNFKIYIDENASQSSKDYIFVLPLPDGLTITSTDFDYEVIDNTIQWTRTLVPNEAAIDFEIIFSTTSMQQARQLNLELSVTVNGQATEEVIIKPLYVLGTPTALINGQDSVTISVEEGQTFTLSAIESINPNIGSDLTYLWRQILGPDLSITETEAEAEISVLAPPVSNDTQAQVELLVTSNNKQSVAATAYINITNKAPPVSSPPNENNSSSGGGGGTWTWLVLWLLAILVLFRMFDYFKPKA